METVYQERTGFIMHDNTEMELVDAVINARHVDRDARDTAVAILDDIIMSNTLTKDTIRHWPKSYDKTVNTTRAAVRRMVNAMWRGFYRNISNDIPFFMLKQLQNMQAVLMGDYKAKITNPLVVRTFAIIAAVLFAGVALVLSYFQELDLMPKFLIKPLFGITIPIAISLIALSMFPSLLEYAPVWWPFCKKELYKAAMINFGEKLANPDYLKNHRMAGIYKWRTSINPDSPYGLDRIKVLMILYGCPLPQCLPNDKEKTFLRKIPAVLLHVLKKCGDCPGSPFYDMLRRAEFFLTTEKPYGAIPPLYSTAQQLAYTFVSIIVSIGIICMVNIIRPDLLEPSAGKIILAAIVLMILITPVIITNYKSEKSAVKRVVQISYWPFESQEDFDDAVKEHPQTAYLLDNHDLQGYYGDNRIFSGIFL